MGQNKYDKHLVSAELQDSDALGEEIRSAMPIEIAISEPTGSVAPFPPNLESPITDNVVTPKPSNKAPVDEVFGQLHSLSVDISLSCDQLPATEHHDQGRRSPQTAEPEGTQVALCEFISRTEENFELHPDRLNVGPSSVVANEQNAELQGRLNHTDLQNDVAIPHDLASTSQQPNQAVRENDVAIPQEVASTSGRPNQAIPQVDIDAGNLHGPGFLLNPTRYPPSCNSPLSLIPDPLQNEIERMHKEAEQLEKNYADTVSLEILVDLVLCFSYFLIFVLGFSPFTQMAQLKYECEKEIEEMISQIRNKYEVKYQEKEAEFRLKKNENDKNEKKVHLSKMLAAAFRSKCGIRPSRLPNMQQGTIPEVQLLFFFVNFASRLLNRQCFLREIVLDGPNLIGGKMLRDCLNGFLVFRGDLEKD